MSYTIIATPQRQGLTTEEQMSRFEEFEEWQLNEKQIKFVGFVTGYYQEQGMDAPAMEHSYEFIVETTSIVDRVASMMERKYQQECILVIHNETQNCYLWNSSNEAQEVIGTWSKVSKELAEQQQGWSVINNQYYTAL